MSLLRHRYLIYASFALFFVATVVGGWLNTVDAKGKVVDDFTSDGVAATLTHGQRSVRSDATGSFDFPDLPRSSSLVIDSPGYLRITVPTTREEIRLSPLALTVVVHEAGPDPDKLVPKADIRQGDKVLGTTPENGSTVISPHPGKDAVVLVCAEGYESRTVTVHGVRLITELTPKAGSACPALQSPSPSASPSGSAAPS